MMRKNFWIIVFGIVIIGSQIAIGANQKQTETGSELVKKSFESDIQPVIKKYCSGFFCHSKFAKYNVFVAKSKKIHYKLSNHLMPPSSVKGFPEENRNLIIKWIDANLK